MRFIKSLTVALLLILSSPLKAEEENKPSNPPLHDNPVLLVLLAEGAVALNAKMASNDPHAYGWIGALLFPLLGSGDSGLQLGHAGSCRSDRIL